MNKVWVGIESRPGRTRILALDGNSDPILKARLFPLPASHLAPRALLEALALWQGHKVHAALVVGGPGSSGANLSQLAFQDFGNALYSLDYVPALRPPRRRDRLDGLGDFRDLRRRMRCDMPQ